VRETAVLLRGCFSGFFDLSCSDSIYTELGVALEELAEDGSGMFAESAVGGVEGSGEMRVDVEFADNFAVNEDGDHDFGFRFKRTREIAGIGIDVVDDDGLAHRDGSAANALVQRDARVGSRGAHEWAENENVWVTILFEHIKADPIVTGEFFVKESDDAFHESIGGVGGNGERVESLD